MSSSVARRAAALPLALALLGLSPRSEVRAVRPAVALRVAIDAPLYRESLGDAQCTRQCRELERMLADALRPMLRQSYQFLDWPADGAPATDTVEIRWQQAPPPETPKLRLELRVASRAPGMSSASAVDFEEYYEALDRPPQQWRPDSLRRIWLPRLDQRLTNPELIGDVFGRIPVPISVSFPSPTLMKVTGPLSELGFGARVRPRFRLRAVVVDPARQTREEAFLYSRPCELGADSTSFRCDVDRLWYDGPNRIVDGDSLNVLLSRATSSVRSVHVWDYPITRGDRFGGAALPPPERER